MIEQELIELIKQLKELSPVVWEAAMRQVQVDLYHNIFWLIAWVIILVTCGSQSWKMAKVSWILEKDDYQGEVWGVVWPVLCLFTIIAVLFIAGTAYNILCYWLNPEWAAIQKILELVN